MQEEKQINKKQNKIMQYQLEGLLFDYYLKITLCDLDNNNLVNIKHLSYEKNYYEFDLILKCTKFFQFTGNYFYLLFRNK